ncbi:hypothetical protein F0P96_19210 [Hymenobacter busanensis]|uniref:Uncharacterized protein n=1 Tax=Hymenobacter busanensis TaxID=2607656 RepID=A0A7L4ZTW6_9BACT|nr:hypothetical protein [Hymenobacter busanensis]KAA9325895.1 hypothetical protein F0P96_19210 [Hymenobacter busanensis]QHJ06265.1 hypothetical protein GUY19_02715 [Hymenobacter busanensis]
MKTPAFLPALFNSARGLGLRAWQTGPLFRKAFLTAVESVQEVLRAEVQKGNAKVVADFLTDKAAPAVKALLLERMSVRLLARLGLRGALASNVAGWILPFVVEKLVRAALRTEAAAKLQTHPTVTNVRRTLDELHHKLRRTVAPDYGSGAAVLDDEDDAPQGPSASLLPASAKI